jgi:hypothetical protein
VAGGAAAALFGAWLFAALYLSAGNRTEVLVVAEDVSRLDTIERSDVRVARLSLDASVDTIAADRLDEFVGRIAAVDLVAGSLLTEQQVRAQNERVVDADEAVVGVLLRPGDGPTAVLRRGTPVTVVVRPSASASPAAIEQVPGWVLDAGGAALNNRDRAIDVVVARDRAAVVSAAAAERLVTVVALGE